jgi:hypothetical protein
MNPNEEHPKSEKPENHKRKSPEKQVPEYAIAVDVIRALKKECFRHNAQVETGGILIGPKDTRIVTAQVVSSRFAERLPTTYYQNEQDVLFLNQQLRRYQASGQDFNGYWHLHPRGYTQLSGGDLQSAKEVLCSKKYKICGELIMMIMELFSSEMPFTYLVHLDKGEPVVENVKLSIMPHSQIVQFTKYLKYLPPQNEREKGAMDEYHTSRHNKGRYCFDQKDPLRIADCRCAYHQFLEIKRSLQQNRVI